MFWRNKKSKFETPQITDANFDEIILSQHFKIKSIPTLMFIKDGHLMDRFQGLVPKPNLAEFLEEYIKMGKVED